MKLTNAIREAFVRSAMNDVPEVDYSELIRSAVVAAYIKALPPAVRKVHDDEKLRQYLNVRFVTFGGVSVQVWCYQTPRYARDEPDSVDIPVLSAADRKALDALVSKKLAQDATREALEKKLSTAAYAVNTRKALADMLPEFARYLPHDMGAADRSLPVVANIVAEFTKAGWPKVKKPATAAKATT